MRPYGIKAHKNLDDTKNTIRLLQEEFRAKRGIRFAIIEKTSMNLIGDCGFWRIDERRLRAEGGGKINPLFARQGLMTEALLHLARYSFAKLGMHAVEGNVAVDNVAPQKLLEKIGFRREGMRREFTYCAYEERFKDSYLYSLLRDDFLRNHDASSNHNS
jgi:ribosomal-protein-alanine N-acetyltransferase